MLVVELAVEAQRGAAPLNSMSFSMPSVGASSCSPCGDARDAQILSALRSANAAQPSYSAVLPQCTWLVPAGSLPRTVKGGVQRARVERMLGEAGELPYGARRLKLLGRRRSDGAVDEKESSEAGEEGEEIEEAEYSEEAQEGDAQEGDAEARWRQRHHGDEWGEWADSLQAVGSSSSKACIANGGREESRGSTGSEENAGGSVGGVVLCHMYLACMALVLLHHLPKVRESCAACGVGMGTVDLLGEALAMPAFAALAGVRDRSLTTPRALGRVALRTTVLLGGALLLAHFSSLPDRAWWFYR